MKNIILCIKDICLGYLTEDCGRYVFYSQAEGIAKAKYEYPLEMMLFRLNASGVCKYETIPYPFSSFMAGTYREDLMLKAGINPLDSEFVRLYKLAGLRMTHQNFQIYRAK